MPPAHRNTDQRQSISRNFSLKNPSNKIEWHLNRDKSQLVNISVNNEGHDSRQTLLD